MFIQISQVNIFHLYYHMIINLSIIKEINMKIRTNYILHDISNIKNLDPSNIEIDKKLFTILVM